MKKLVLMFVAIAAISFASCNGNSKPAANVDTTAQDSAVDSLNLVLIPFNLAFLVAFKLSVLAS